GDGDALERRRAAIRGEAAPPDPPANGCGGPRRRAHAGALARGPRRRTRAGLTSTSQRPMSDRNSGRPFTPGRTLNSAPAPGPSTSFWWPPAVVTYRFVRSGPPKMALETLRAGNRIR